MLRLWLGIYALVSLLTGDGAWAQVYPRHGAPDPWLEHSDIQKYVSEAVFPDLPGMEAEFFADLKTEAVQTLAPKSMPAFKAAPLPILFSGVVGGTTPGLAGEEQESENPPAPPGHYVFNHLSPDRAPAAERVEAPKESLVFERPTVTFESAKAQRTAPKAAPLPPQK